MRTCGILSIEVRRDDVQSSVNSAVWAYIVRVLRVLTHCWLVVVS